VQRTDMSVGTLIDKIKDGEIRLPEMQRPYVWRSSRVRDLFDSLYREYPSGAILLWATGDNTIPLRDFAVEQSMNGLSTIYLLLDGQQRLTSLSAVIRGTPLHVKGRSSPMELLFNLEHPDHLEVVTEVEDNEGNGKDAEDTDETEAEAPEATKDELLEIYNKMTFVVAFNRLERVPQWVKVSDVFKMGDMEILEQAGIKDFKDPRGKKYQKRLAQLRRIQDYTYRLDILGKNLSYEEVTEIFVRVNSLGAKLRGSDLALAQITAKWQGSLKIFETFQEECARNNFDLDLGVHLRNLVIFATGQSKFSSLSSLNKSQLQEAWEKVCGGVRFAIDFLRNNTGIDNPNLLSSPNLISILAYFCHMQDYRLPPDEARQLRYWILLANAKARFSRGSVETLMDQDLSTIRQEKPISEMINRLQTQFGRLDIVEEELEGRNQSSALFKTMFLAFRYAGAEDWNSIKLSSRNAEDKNLLEAHHIFPQAVIKDKYDRQEVNDIANLAFIGARTNKKISNAEPKDYFLELLDERGGDGNIFSTQAIPYQNRELLEVKNYKAFLAERRKLIAKTLNEFIGECPGL